MHAKRLNPKTPTGHDAAFWQGIYDKETRPEWDMKKATPLVQELLDAASDLGLQVGPSVVVPGCGYGHDAAEFARQGYSVTGVDFADAAVQGARQRYGDLVAWRQEDWFGPWDESYDALFDHTCFAAMTPDARPGYLQACARRLKPGALWLGAFFHTVTGESGPPFPISMEELRPLAERHFEILRLAPAQRSHPRRAGREFLIVARRK